MSRIEFFWNVFERFGSIDAYIGYAHSKNNIGKNNIEENRNGFYEHF